MMRALLIFFVILTWCSAIYSQDDNPCEHPDYKALVALYNATNGPDWTNSTNWDDGTGMISCDPCADDWFGVTCNLQNRVDRIWLPSKNLVGHIPKEIGELNKLRHLQLSGNSLVGEIPSDIVMLKELVWLYLFDNNLSGRIPVEICQLTQLEQISLGSNQFYGSIPDCIGELYNLTTLLLYANSLSGSIPSSIGNLTNLSHVFLYANSLTGTLPESFSALTNLVQFDVSWNELYGCFPASYTELCATEKVSTHDNLSTSLNETAWTSFCSSGGSTASMHPDYPALIAFYNATNGPFWHDNDNWDDGTVSVSCDPCGDSWFGVTCVGGRVTELRLGDNNLSGSLPAEIGQLEYLEHLDLINNLISGEIPKELGRIADLEYLDLGRNQFEGSLPMELGDLGNLSDFYIDENRFVGCWPSNMSGICGLARFEMDGNVSSTISNAGWAGFCATQEGQVHIDYDPLISIYKELDGVNWEHEDNWEPYNSCDSPCNDWWGVTCTGGRVTGLDLSLNDLKGVLPDKMEGLTELTGIDLAGNEIEGEFPGPLEDLDQLTLIRMKGNQLRGELPTIMPWPNLDTLVLGDNYLIGEVPNVQHFGGWGNLKFINLQDNLFSGSFSIPAFFNNTLQFYTVANNYLVGCFQNRSFEFCAHNITIQTHGNLTLGDFEQYCDSGSGGCNTCTAFEEILLNDDPFELGHIDLVNSTIRSGGRIGMDNSVMLQSNQAIELNSEFTVEMNSNLILKIDDCSSPLIRNNASHQR